MGTDHADLYPAARERMVPALGSAIPDHTAIAASVRAVGAEATMPLEVSNGTTHES
jgi:hypothetical protein